MGFQHETWGEARGGQRPRSSSLCQRGAAWPEREGRALTQGYRAQPSLTATRVCKQGPAQGLGHALAERASSKPQRTGQGPRSFTSLRRSAAGGRRGQQGH